MGGRQRSERFLNKLERRSHSKEGFFTSITRRFQHRLSESLYYPQCFSAQRRHCAAPPPSSQTVRPFDIYLLLLLSPTPSRLMFSCNRLVKMPGVARPVNAAAISIKSNVCRRRRPVMCCVVCVRTRKRTSVALIRRPIKLIQIRTVCRHRRRGDRV